MLTFKELVVNGSSFALLLSSMQLKEVGASFQPFKGFVCVSNLLAGGKENEYFRFLMTFNETEESIKLLFNVHSHIVMEKFQWSNVFKLLGKALILCAYFIC